MAGAVGFHVEGRAGFLGQSRFIAQGFDPFRRQMFLKGRVVQAGHVDDLAAAILLHQDQPVADKIVTAQKFPAHPDRPG